MRFRFTLAVLILLAPAVGAAQSDIVVRPDPVGISVGDVQTNATGAGLQTCLILDDGVLDPDYLANPANRFECQPSSSGSITSHTTLVPEGGGAITVRSITVRTETDGSEAVSDASPNSKKVLDVPSAPTIISGHPELASGVA